MVNVVTKLEPVEDEMRLVDFIATNIEPILMEWEVFARSIWRQGATSPETLRDHAEAILVAAVKDMVSVQTSAEQAMKSKGQVPARRGATALLLEKASVQHGVGRLRSGFDLLTLISEYRALRASVIRLWRESKPVFHQDDLDDLTRFSECIDQSLAEAAHGFAQHAEQSREMFLAIVGHDLRNPLNSVTLSGHMLMMEPTLGEESKHAAQQIVTSAQAMGQIVTDLLDFTSSRLGGAMPVTKGHLDLGALCREVVSEIQTGNPGREVRLEMAGDVTLQADRARMRQVLSNLIANGLQHGEAHGGVDIRVWAAGSEAWVHVHNGGQPIPAGTIETIFDPLTRGPTTKKRRAGSIGLGLFIAREIVTAHGGSITVKSTAEEGTTFLVKMPLGGGKAA